jgi:hypothetical protein
MPKITAPVYFNIILYLSVIYYNDPSLSIMSTRRGQNNDKAEQQALKEAEIVAELAPDKRTRKEAEKLLETLEDKSIPDFREAERAGVDDVLDETKKVIGKTTNQAKREIPRYTQALTDIQVETMQTTKQIGYDCIELQKEMNSLLPEMQQKYGSWFTPWWSTRFITEYYTKLLDNFVDNTVAATNLANSLAVVNLESIQKLSDTSREYWRLTLNSVRDIKQSMTD